MSEYVYCLSNPDYTENLYKIGFTNNPQRRVEELYSTGVPSNFIIEFIIQTPDGKKLERIIHEKLKNYRTNIHREFFRIPMTTLKNILENEMNLTNYIDTSEMKPLIDELQENTITHFECNCGSKVLISHKARHLKSPGHLNIKTNETVVEKEEYYNCSCGSKVLITNKSRHLKSTKHNVKKEEEKEKEEEEKEKEEEQKEKEEEQKEKEEEEEKYYICNCGKYVLKSNKYNHNNMPYHMHWASQFIDEYTS